MMIIMTMIRFSRGWKAKRRRVRFGVRSCECGVTQALFRMGMCVRMLRVFSVCMWRVYNIFCLFRVVALYTYMCIQFAGEQRVDVSETNETFMKRFSVLCSFSTQIFFVLNVRVSYSDTIALGHLARSRRGACTAATCHRNLSPSLSLLLRLSFASFPVCSKKFLDN